MALSDNIILGVGFDLADARAEAGRVAEAMEAEFERRFKPTMQAVQGQAGSPATGRPSGGSALGGLGSAGGALALGGGLLLGGAFASSQFIQQATEIAELGTEVRRTRAAFVEFSGGADIAEAKLRAIQEASGGTVDEMDAMQIANRAAALGMADTAAELDRVTRFARTASAILGGDVASMLDNLAAASSNLSFERLDQMGVSSSRVRERMQELSETTSNLTKEQMFLQAALEVGEEAFAGMDAVVAESTSGVELFRVAYNNMRHDMAAGPIGQLIDDAFRGAANVLDPNAVAALGKLAEALKSSRIESNQLRGELVENMLAAIEQVDALAVAGVDGAAEMRDALIDTAGRTANGMNRMTDSTIAGINQQIEAVGRLAYAWGSAQDAAVDAAADAVVTAAQIEATAARILGQIESFNQTGSIYGTEQRLSPSYSGTDYGTPGSFDSRMNDLRGQSERARELNAAAGQRAATEKKIAEEAQAEWEAAAKAAADNWAGQLEGALKKVPGLYDASGVTGEDLAAAEAGTYVEKADEILRQFEAQVYNGDDYGIDPEDIRQRIGLGEGASMEEIAKEFRRQWDTSELFADGQNLDLINTAAVELELERQERAASGEQAIAEYFGLSAENGAVVVPAALKLTENPMMTTGSGGEEGSGDQTSYLQPVYQQMQAELEDEDFMADLQGLGKSALAIVHSGWSDGAPEFQWVDPIIAAARDQAAAAMANMANSGDVA